ncbi:hypothetical protein C2G38_2255753, partial [Gigaspora rosea]
MKMRFYQNELHINAEEGLLSIQTLLDFLFTRYSMFHHACYMLNACLNLICTTNRVFLFTLCVSTNYVRKKTNLFLFAHELVDKAITWFSVGCYNFLIGQNDEARRYF